MKRLLGLLAGAAAPAAVVRHRSAGRLLVLSYHGVLASADDTYVNRQCVDADMFDAQLTWLRRHFQVVSLSTAVARCARGEALPPRAVALTFDDGLKNVLDTALPILQRHGAPATCFVCTGYVGGDAWLWMDAVNGLVLSAPGPYLECDLGGRRRRFRLSAIAERERAAESIRSHLKRLGPGDRAVAIEQLRALSVIPPQSPHWSPGRHSLLGWDDLRALVAGGVEVGSHGQTHTVLSGLQPEAARHEIAESSARIERETGQCCELFSYPNGTAHDFSTAHESMLREHGYTAAVTQIRGLNRPDANPMALRRVNVSRVRSLPFFVAEIAAAAVR